MTDLQEQKKYMVPQRYMLQTDIVHLPHLAAPLLREKVKIH